MLNTDRYSIDNKKLISRLLPFFVNGRKLFAFILSCVHPLESIHLQWRAWALNRLVEAMATSQPIVIRWYLTKIFQPYFANKSKKFETNISEPEQYAYIFENDVDERANGAGLMKWWVYDSVDDMVMVVGSKGGEESLSWLYLIEKGEMDSFDTTTFTIYAPMQINSLDKETYINLIRQQFEKYLVYDDVDYVVNVVND